MANFFKIFAIKELQIMATKKPMRGNPGINVQLVVRKNYSCSPRNISFARNQ